MLAVTSSPHGFEITLTGAATLSQAHLIQPGRALVSMPTEWLMHLFGERFWELLPFLFLFPVDSSDEAFFDEGV